MNEPFKLSATEAIKLIAKNNLTHLEWVSSCIERIKIKESITKAWTFLDFDQAKKQAKNLDKGNKKQFGIPIGVKDIIDVFGMPTQMGTSFYEDNIPLRDAASVAIAKNAGCIILGKTVTTELGHRHPGPTTNPHNTKYTPGGSSSGSAASVADFMIPISFGTQTTGSIIRPAAYCGIIGYKPTYGDFDKSGILPNSPTFDTLGLMARSIADIELMRKIILEEQIHLKESFMLKDIKFAFIRTPHWEDYTDISTKVEIENFISYLKKSNINVSEVNINDLIKEASDIHTQLSGFEFKRSISTERINYFNELSEILRKGRLSEGNKLTLNGYRELQRRLKFIRLKIDEKLKNFHCILTPSAPGEALKDLEFTGSPIFNTVWTLTGMPAITLPLFKGKNNLPIGIQIICHLNEDEFLLKTSKMILELVNQNEK